jgi:hypothetical protein
MPPEKMPPDGLHQQIDDVTVKLTGAIALSSE